MKQSTTQLMEIARHHRYAVIAGVMLLGWGFLSPVDALTHTTGTTTYNQNFGNGSVINVSGGQATFNGKVQNNSVVNVSGGTAIFNGDLFNNVVFNLSGGETIINSVKNNATFNVSAGEISLNEPIGNNASVSVNGGTLNLGTDDVFGSNTNVTLTNATLNSNGNDFSIDSLTLTGTSTIDLGDDPDAVLNLGAISGSGTLVVTGYVETNQIQFDSGNSTISVGDQVKFGDTPGMIGEDGTIVPVPEPATILGGAGLVVFLIVFEFTRRHRQKKGLQGNK